MKSGIHDTGALESFFATSMSMYMELNPLHHLDPTEAGRAIAELRADLHLDLHDAHVEPTKRMISNFMAKSRQKPFSDAASHQVSADSSHDMSQNAASLSAPQEAPSP